MWILMGHLLILVPPVESSKNYQMVELTLIDPVTILNLSPKYPPLKVLNTDELISPQFFRSLQ